MYIRIKTRIMEISGFELGPKFKELSKEKRFIILYDTMNNKLNGIKYLSHRAEEIYKNMENHLINNKDIFEMPEN